MIATPEPSSIRVNADDLAMVTKAIGSSIDGFRFEMIEADFGRPGFITIYGKAIEEGRKFEATLQIVELGEVFDDDELGDDA